MSPYYIRPGTLRLPPFGEERATDRLRIRIYDYIKRIYNMTTREALPRSVKEKILRWGEEKIQQGIVDLYPTSDEQDGWVIETVGEMPHLDESKALDKVKQYLINERRRSFKALREGRASGRASRPAARQTAGQAPTAMTTPPTTPPTEPPTKLVTTSPPTSVTTPPTTPPTTATTTPHRTPAARTNGGPGPSARRGRKRKASSDGGPAKRQPKLFRNWKPAGGPAKTSPDNYEQKWRIEVAKSKELREQIQQLPKKYSGKCPNFETCDGLGHVGGVRTKHELAAACPKDVEWNKEKDVALRLMVVCTNYLHTFEVCTFITDSVSIK
jgi:hypothetical protein